MPSIRVIPIYTLINNTINLFFEIEGFSTLMQVHQNMSMAEELGDKVGACTWFQVSMISFNSYKSIINKANISITKHEDN